MNNKTKKILSIVVIAIIIGAGCFFIGYKIGKGGNSFGKNGMDFAGGNMQRGNGMALKNEGMASGEIIAKDDSSITIKLNNGGSKIVFYSETTTISKTVDGAANDLEVGKTIMVSGTTNTDGSVIAKTIQLRSAVDSAMVPPQQP
ncbi:MAG TPA: DUF5666 domain-containing protein [Candidatus Paceibacterota bacterium]|jgi:hypothetical protein|nr:DUF5666 domain-containing protein [Candidatus Paceibacterota bacterium]HPT40283.1 DUF5666 domain-containing protein [Candidatus Paceibacterota bacterium]